MTDTLMERVYNRAVITDDIGECWVWSGAPTEKGYARVTYKKKSYRVHRLTYTDVYGVIPDGYDIDHLCRNRLCINPMHLEAVTPKVNTHRGDGPAGINARKRECNRGHTYDYIKPNGRRGCKQCERIREANRHGR